MKKHQTYRTDIISKSEMEKYLAECCVENPLHIMRTAIKQKTSIYIPELKSILEWIYCGDTPWNYHGKNSDNLDDYNYQLMPQ